MVAKKGVIFLSRSKRWSNNDSHNGIFYQWKRGGLIFETSTLKLFFFPACRRSSRIWLFFTSYFFSSLLLSGGISRWWGFLSWPAYGFYPRDLYLTQNNFTSLPPWIGNLVNLQTLGLIWNSSSEYFGENSLSKQKRNLPKIRLAGRICCFFWKILVFTSCVEKLLSKVYQDWCWENFVRYHQVSWGFIWRCRKCRKIWLQCSESMGRLVSKVVKFFISSAMSIKKRGWRKQHCISSAEQKPKCH